MPVEASSIALRADALKLRPMRDFDQRIITGSLLYNPADGEMPLYAGGSYRL